jgi:uncharacterized alkaline shock family protein YloU
MRTSARATERYQEFRVRLWRESPNPVVRVDGWPPQATSLPWLTKMMNETFETQSHVGRERHADYFTPATSAQGGGGGAGRIIIADLVLAKIAGTAIAESRGIHVLHNAEGTPCGPPHTLVPEDPSCGIEVQSGDGITVTLRLVVDYGAPIGELAQKLREEIASRMQRLTGMTVNEVNVHVTDIFFHQPDAASAEATPGGSTITDEELSDRSSSRYSGILTGRLSERDD